MFSVYGGIWEIFFFKFVNFFGFDAFSAADVAYVNSKGIEG